MRRYLLLDSNFYPVKFNRINNVSPGPSQSGLTVASIVEQNVINAFKTYNNRLAISSVEYGQIANMFPNAFTGSFSGLIIDEFEIEQGDVASKTNSGFYVNNVNGQYYASNIIGYVFLSPPIELSRNIHVSQSIFPELLDYMDRYLQSPSFTIANKPIYFVSIVNDSITAPMILKHCVNLTLLGIQYIDCFPNNNNQSPTAPIKIDDYFSSYYSSDIQIIGQDTHYVNNYFDVDVTNKIFKIKTTDFVVGAQLVLNSNNHLVVNGSYEKFYLIEMLPAAVFAIKSGYSIDLTDYATLCSNNGTNTFAPNNEKLARLRTVLAYLQKLINCRR